MKSALVVISASAAIGLSACATNEQTGQLIGAGAGAVIGNQVGGGTFGTILGAGAGFLLGGAIGKNMDVNDQRRFYSALETAPTGQRTQWRNPDTGHQYTVIPRRTYETNGQPCRDFTTEAFINGRRELVTGTACRQANGTWRAS